MWKRFHLPPAMIRWRFVRRRTPIPLDSSLLDEKTCMVGKFDALRERTIALLQDNKHRDLSAYSWPHPFLGTLAYYDWFRVIGFHELRHAQQIREIVSSFHR
jgi:hypothetical protein